MPDGFYDHKSDDYWSGRAKTPSEPCRECGRTIDVRHAQDPYVAAKVIADHGNSWGWWCTACLRRRREEIAD